MSDKKELVEAAENLDPHLEEMLRGTQAIGIFRDELEKRGFRVPEDYRSKVIDQKGISAANSAVFSLLGGVPAYLLWASENPNKFYELFMKSGAASTPLVNVAAQKIEIISPLSASPLDDIEIDALGRVISDDDISDVL